MTSELAHDTIIGAVLDGRYGVHELIGRGGMASVYRAEDRLLGRTVAIKVFEDAPDSDDFMERKRSEVSVLASLNHPALVTLFDANLEAEWWPYLVMEYVQGPPLHKLLSKGPLPPRNVVTMLRELSDALDVVHSAGIVHRDIKPSNLLLAGVGGARPFRAKLADFGIAQLADSTRLTKPGTFMGTAAYIAPEQAGRAVPAAPADIYSLGLVILECLSGERAFPGTPAESISARINSDPAIPQSVPVALRDLLAAMTARNPEDRPTAAIVHDWVIEAERALEAEAPSDALTTAPLRSDEHAVVFTGGTPTSILSPGTTKVFSNPTGAARARNPEGSRSKRMLWAAVAGAVVVLGVGGFALSGLFTSEESNQPQLPALEAPLDSHFETLFDAVTP